MVYGAKEPRQKPRTPKSSETRVESSSSSESTGSGSGQPEQAEATATPRAKEHVGQDERSLRIRREEAKRERVIKPAKSLRRQQGKAFEGNGKHSVKSIASTATTTHHHNTPEQPPPQQPPLPRSPVYKKPSSGSQDARDDSARKKAKGERNADTKVEATVLHGFKRAA